MSLQYAFFPPFIKPILEIPLTIVLKCPWCHLVVSSSGLDFPVGWLSKLFLKLTNKGSSLSKFFTYPSSIYTVGTLS